MAKEKWTQKLVAARLEEAADTMKRLPEIKPQQHQSAWPPIIREFWEAYGWDQAKVRLGPPLPEAITRMDECMEWLKWLEPEQMQLVWAKAERFPWKEILPRFGMGRTKAWEFWMAALLEIAIHLNTKNQKVVRTSCSNN